MAYPSALPEEDSLFDYILRRTKDVGISGAKGIVGLGEAGVGLAGYPFGGLPGKLLEEYTPIQFAKWQKGLEEQYSPEQKAANKAVAEAKGFFPTIGAALENPSVIGHTVLESLPAVALTRGMAGGLSGAAGRWLPKAAKYITPAVAGGAAEGLVGMGQTAESLRQESPDKLLSTQDQIAALGTGLTTGALGVLGGKLAQRLGVVDPDIPTDLAARQAARAAGEVPKGRLRSLAEGAVSEGIFEEMPQSATEQMWMNYAQGKPLTEGVGEAAAMGMLAGAAMGGPIQLLQQNRQEALKGIQDAEDEAKAAEEALVAQRNADIETGKSPVSMGSSSPTLEESQREQALQEKAGVVQENAAAQVAGIEQEAAAREPELADLSDYENQLAQEANADPIAVKQQTRSFFEAAQGNFQSFARMIRDTYNKGVDFALRLWQDLKRIYSQSFLSDERGSFSIEKKLPMKAENIEKIKAGAKTATTRTQPLQQGDYKLSDGTVITVENNTRPTWIHELRDPEAYARAEGYESLEDMAQNSGFNHIKQFIAGERPLHIAKFSVKQPKAELPPLEEEKPLSLPTQTPAEKFKGQPPRNTTEIPSAEQEPLTGEYQLELGIPQKLSTEEAAALEELSPLRQTEGEKLAAIKAQVEKNVKDYKQGNLEEEIEIPKRAINPQFFEDIGEGVHDTISGMRKPSKVHREASEEEVRQRAYDAGLQVVYDRFKDIRTVDETDESVLNQVLSKTSRKKLGETPTHNANAHLLRVLKKQMEQNPNLMEEGGVLADSIIETLGKIGVDYNLYDVVKKIFEQESIAQDRTIVSFAQFDSYPDALIDVDNYFRAMEDMSAPEVETSEEVQQEALLFGEEFRATPDEAITTETVTHLPTQQRMEAQKALEEKSKVSRPMSEEERDTMERAETRKEAEKLSADRKAQVYRLWKIRQQNQKTQKDYEGRIIHENLGAFYKAMLEIAGRGKATDQNFFNVVDIQNAMKRKTTLEFSRLPSSQQRDLIKQMLRLSYLPWTFEYRSYKKELDDQISLVAENIDKKPSEGAPHGVEFYEPFASETREGPIKTLNIQHKDVPKFKIGSVDYWDHADDLANLAEMAREYGLWAEIAASKSLTTKQYVDYLRNLKENPNKTKAAQLVFARELLIVKTRLAQIQLEEMLKREIEPNFFEKIAEQNEDLGLTPADIFQEWLAADQTAYGLTNRLVDIRQAKAFQESNALYKKMVVAINEGNLEATAEAVREYTSSTLPNGLQSLYKSWASEYQKTGRQTVLDPRMRAMFNAMLNYELKVMAGAATKEYAANKKVKEFDTSLANELYPQFRPNLQQYFSTKAVQTIEEHLISSRLTKGSVGRLNNRLVHKFYQLVAKLFGAELIVVADPEFTSRYIPELVPGGKSVIVINAQHNSSFHFVFAHEMFHHIVNKANPNAYKAFKESLREIVGEDKFDAFVRKKGNLSYELAEEEVLADLFASVMHDRAFYVHLAKTYEGRLLSGRLIGRLIEGVSKVWDVMNTQPNPYLTYEGRKVLGTMHMAKVHELITDLITSGGKNLQHKQTRFFNGQATVDEINGYIEAPKSWLGGIWKTVFPPGSKSYRDVMNGIEKLLIRFRDFIKETKPAGIFADLFADPSQVRLANKMAHAAELDLQKAYQRVIKKHIDTFKGMDKKALEKMHDDLVRGKVDVTTPEGVDEAKALGYSDEVIAAFKDFKTYADEIHKKLQKIYPGLSYVATHYGQSLRWRKKNKVLVDDEFDAILDLPSRLKGTEHFTGAKAFDVTSEDIRKKHGVEYDTIDPIQLFQNYVRDTARIIHLHEAMKSALSNVGKNGKPIAKIFPNPWAASREGYFGVDDASTEVLDRMGRIGYAVIFSDGEPYRVDGSIVYYATEAEAQQEAIRLANSDQFLDEEVGPRVVAANTVIEKTPMYWRIKGNDRTFATEGDANEYANKLKAANPDHDFEVEVVSTPAKNDVPARIYFQKDLARMMNVLLAKDTLRNAEAFGFSGHNAMNIKNKMTSIEFALSLFHAMTIGQELTSSYAGWALKRKGTGKRGIVPILNLSKARRESMELVTLLEGFIENEDWKNNDVYRKKLAELLGTEDLDIADMIQQYHEAGGFLHQDSDLRSELFKLGEMRYTKAKGGFEVKDGQIVFNYGKLKDLSFEAIHNSFKEVYAESLRNEPDKQLKAVFNVGQFAALEATTAWLMEHLIPRVKMAQWVREYTLKLEQKKDLIALGLITKDEIARDTMKFIEDRFGEVNWKNMWMKPSYKTALQFIFRSFTWFTGSWKALSKAGFDFVRAGWMTVKMSKNPLNPKELIQNFHLTEKGLWGINAIASHMMTVGLITLMYSLGADDDEVPDDEETPWLTKALFPRIDAADPESRLSVPSYVTEFYKIARHVGVIGDEAEYAKLISGRTNSLISNMMDVGQNEDWRGVQIYDPLDPFIVQQWSKIAHTFGVLPISVSTAKKNWEEKGVYGLKPMALAGIGFVDAPAAAKRSEATNKAFEIRRKEYKGREVTEEQMEEKTVLKRAMVAYQHGDKSEVEALIAEGRVSRRQFELALSKIPTIAGVPNRAYKDRLSQAIKGLTIEGSLQVWEKMSDAEKQKHKKEIYKKYSNMMARKDRPPQVKQEIRTKMKELGIIK